MRPDRAQRWISAVLFVFAVLLVCALVWDRRRAKPPDVPLVLSESFYQDFGGGWRWYLARNMKDLERIGQLSGADGIVFGDGESGPGVQFGRGSPMPPVMALGAAGDAKLAYRAGFWAANGFRLLGIDSVYAPCADVFVTSAPSVLGWRSFGADPKRVGQLAMAYADGMFDGGVIPVVKHFPGHGMTRVDTHAEIGLTSLTLQEAADTHAAAFAFLRDRPRYAVMLAHLGHSERRQVLLTANSPFWMDHLRNTLGFQGLTMTDSANMLAVREAPGGEVGFVVEALARGVDLIVEPTRTHENARAYFRALKTGKIASSTAEASRQRLEEFRRRVVAQRKLPKPDKDQWIEEGEKLSREIARRAAVGFGRRLHDGRCDQMAFRVIRKDGVSGPLADSIAVLNLKDTAVAACDLEEMTPATGRHWCLLYFGAGTGEKLHAPWSASEMHWLRAARKSGAKVTVVVFGNPIAGLALERFDNVAGLCVWGRSRASCEAAAEWLHGELEPVGQWPIAPVEEGAP